MTTGARFAGKVILITGGGTGIGAATARRIAAEGGKVVVTGRRRGPIDEIAQETGGLAFAGDAADPDDLAAAIAGAVKAFGGLDGVIANAAGVAAGSILDIPLDGWKESCRINIDGPMLLARLAVPELRKRGGGSIVLVASLAAISGAPDMASYLTTKAALLGLSRSIAYDYGRDNIRSNVVCPGWVRTEMANAAIQMFADKAGCSQDAMADHISRTVAMRRMATPEEMAAVITFLASEDSSCITGTELTADNGARIFHGGSFDPPA
jgi:NAD(P)-dependent dehydrogenase (short-subunit alcohol dehydrogenase family)